MHMDEQTQPTLTDLLVDFADLIGRQSLLISSLLSERAQLLQRLAALEAEKCQCLTSTPSRQG